MAKAMTPSLNASVLEVSLRSFDTAVHSHSHSVVSPSILEKCGSSETILLAFWCRAVAAIIASAVGIPRWRALRVAAAIAIGVERSMILKLDLSIESIRKFATSTPDSSYSYL